MADKKKSIIDEVLMDAKKIQEALNANTKEILRSIAKEEISDLVNESLSEFEEEDIDVDTDLDMDAEAPVDGIGDTGIEDESGLEMDDSAEGDLEMGDEVEMGVDSPFGDELDMTSASDDEVLAIYKKLDGEDEIQVVSNDNGDIELTVNGFRCTNG